MAYQEPNKETYFTSPKTERGADVIGDHHNDAHSTVSPEGFRNVARRISCNYLRSELGPKPEVNREIGRGF